jgi:hypothetical protein
MLGSDFDIKFKQGSEEDRINYCIDNFNSLNSSDWSIISIQELSEEFINKFICYLDLGKVQYFSKLSQNFINSNLSKIDLSVVFRTQKLSEEFIRNNLESTKWFNISKFQDLSDTFIIEFKDKVDWSEISAFQRLSIKLILEFEDKINWKRLSNNDKVSEEIRLFAKIFIPKKAKRSKSVERPVKNITQKAAKPEAEVKPQPVEYQIKYKQCIGKVKYEKQSLAVAYCTKYYHKYKKQQRVYKCTLCDGFHITTRV